MGLLDNAKQELAHEQFDKIASEWEKIKSELFNMISMITLFETRLRQCETLVAACIEDHPKFKHFFEESTNETDTEKTEEGKD